MGAQICTCLFWSFGASRAGRCEFGRVWSSPITVRGVSNCAQHLRDGTASVHGGQSAIAPSSAEARDCRSPWLASPLCTSTQKLARNIFLSYEFSHEKCSENFPEIFEPLFCGSEKSRKIPAKIPTKFPSQKSKKIHRRASAGAQGEDLRSQGSGKEGWGGGCGPARGCAKLEPFVLLALGCHTFPVPDVSRERRCLQTSPE